MLEGKSQKTANSALPCRNPARSHPSVTICFWWTLEIKPLSLCQATSGHLCLGNKNRESKSIRVGFETQAHKPWPHCVFSPYINAFGSPCARHPPCLPPGLLAILVSSLILLLDVSEVVRAPFATIKPWLRHRLMVAPDHQNWAEKGQKSRRKVKDGEIYGYLWWCQLMLFPKWGLVFFFPRKMTLFHLISFYFRNYKK